MRQAQGTDHVISGLAAFAQVVRSIKAGIGMGLQELQKIVALDEIELAGLQSLRRQFIRFAGNRPVEAEHFTGLSYAQDQRLPIPRRSGQLHTPHAQDVDAARRLPLHEQDRSLREGARIFDLLQMLQRRLRKVAEEAGLAQLADETVLGDLKPVRRIHSTPRTFSGYLYSSLVRQMLGLHRTSMGFPACLDRKSTRLNSSHLGISYA